MSDTTYSNRAESLVRALETVDLTGHHDINPDGGTKHYVTVRRPIDHRYPSATVWIDQDGYTWGHNYEHTANGDVATTVVARLIKDTLPVGE